MRLFIAVDLDDDARAAIGAAQERLAQGLGRPRSEIRWVRVDQMHLTLVFLGEVPEGAAAAVGEAVAREVAQPAFELGFDGLGVFPPHGAPRVVWLGVAEGAREVAALHGEMTDRVGRLGIALEDRAFHAHLTLGRWRESRAGARRVALAAGGPGPVARVRVDHATLYQSRLSPAGPAYTPLARANLSPGRV
jgi:RNA 2',3'-cyclic 3'-phosphodiesterase